MKEQVREEEEEVGDDCGVVGRGPWMVVEGCV